MTLSLSSNDSGADSRTFGLSFLYLPFFFDLILCNESLKTKTWIQTFDICDLIWTWTIDVHRLLSLHLLRKFHTSETFYCFIFICEGKKKKLVNVSGTERSSSSETEQTWSTPTIILLISFLSLVWDVNVLRRPPDIQLNLWLYSSSLIFTVFFISAEMKNTIFF